MRTSPLLAVLILLPFAAAPMDDGRTFEVVIDQVDSEPSPEEIARGEQVYELVCSACHTLDPPPDSAPPMRHLVRHLRRDLATFEAFSEHVQSYVPAPDAERSLLPPMAIERFGVMAPLPLADDVLYSAAAYLWSLSAPKEGMGRRRGINRPGGAAR